MNVGPWKLPGLPKPRSISPGVLLDYLAPRMYFVLYSKRPGLEKREEFFYVYVLGRRRWTLPNYLIYLWKKKEHFSSVGRKWLIPWIQRYPRGSYHTEWSRMKACCRPVELPYGTRCLCRWWCLPCVVVVTRFRWPCISTAVKYPNKSRRKKKKTINQSTNWMCPEIGKDTPDEKLARMIFYFQRHLEPASPHRLGRFQMSSGENNEELERGMAGRKGGRYPLAL